MAPIPITIITGFLGSGKTTLILNLIPQLPPSYKLALLKNEFGDVAVDSQLASSRSISGVQELLNGCICCNLVGQLGDALETLRTSIQPDRIVIETSGSAFPASLAMEVNRLADVTGSYALDGVLNVIDVENWGGYGDTSYTAKLQAKFTDLIVLNKWEQSSERRIDECLDRIGDLDVEIAQVKSDRGRVDQGVVFGLDGKLAHLDGDALRPDDHTHGHQNEVEVLSVTLPALEGSPAYVDLEKLQGFLREATKEEVYRIKAIVYTSAIPNASSGNDLRGSSSIPNESRFILNWAFGRWSFTPVPLTSAPLDLADSMPNGSDSNIPFKEQVRTRSQEPVVRMTIITARSESTKWKKRIESGRLIAYENGDSGALKIEQVLAP